LFVFERQIDPALARYNLRCFPVLDAGGRQAFCDPTQPPRSMIVGTDVHQLCDGTRSMSMSWRSLERDRH